MKSQSPSSPRTSSPPCGRGPELPLLGLMLGYPTGIGPEQCARVLSDRRWSDAGRLVVVGDARVLAQGARDAGVAFEWRVYSSPEDIDWSRTDVPLIDLRNHDPAGISRGAISAERAASLAKRSST